ncbi:diphosphate--fructose-6-phosphate 1-phosphotransferase [Pseudalkalibacillus decolorationis]|uniref:diphosphate--fructose-6-phosphate 1-phosphotransferase n=1 Tax=Pseudalkalibacillus decolorationis TaxID=163879 RepID=UPI0021486B96|nr:diphosphate--fructose-6-phosphate 1-phosphotransferase [Pseudalkalibacillus decolorationis]
MKKIAIGQAGGPTTVINATLAGFVKEMTPDFSLFFIQNGYQGLVRGDLLEGNEENINWVLEHQNVPGACLGSGRYPFTDEKLEKAVQNLRQNSIEVLVFIGGNGTMEALNKVEKAAKDQGYDLQVIGLPKTVDNDLGCTDHAPGFGSSARYVAQATRDISRDLHAMRNFEQVRILETMGRNAGWLAAASGLLKTFEEEGPQFIGLPERPMKQLDLLSTVEDAIRKYGCATVVISEGVKWSEGVQIQREEVNGRAVLGGISGEVELFLKKELNIMARSELLGINQRSSSQSVSNLDRYESFLTGITGGKWIKEGWSGIMVSMQRDDDIRYNVDMKPVQLEDVVKAGERLMPAHFIDNRDRYYEWLLPLVGDELPTYPPMIQRRDLYVNQQN